MRQNTTLALFLIGSLFFSSCKREESINIDQNRIYSQYAYTYDANNSSTKISATFRLDNSSGKKLELSYPSRVSFQGESLTWKNALGYYDLNRSGELLSGDITFYDLQEKTYTNTINNISPIDLPFGITSISKNGNFFLPWVGGGLMAGETIRITIKGNQNSKSWTVNTIGSTHVLLNESRLNDLSAGQATIQIEREKTCSLTESNLSGGRITSKYLSRKVSIDIID